MRKIARDIRNHGSAWEMFEKEEAKGGVPFIPLLILFILFIFAAGGSHYYKKQQEMKDQKLTEAAQEETMGESNEEATRA